MSFCSYFCTVSENYKKDTLSVQLSDLTLNTELDDECNAGPTNAELRTPNVEHIT